jgi:hypothetical protein
MPSPRENTTRWLPSRHAAASAQIRARYCFSKVLLAACVVGFLLTRPCSAKCPNSCNQNGECNTASSCVCFPGFTGNDCSQSTFARVCRSTVACLLSPGWSIKFCRSLHGAALAGADQFADVISWLRDLSDGTVLVPTRHRTGFTPLYHGFMLGQRHL